jgi:hypothetical protein
VRDGSDGNSQVELQLRNKTPMPGQQRGARLCRHHHPKDQVRNVVNPGHFGTDPDPLTRTTGLWIRIRILHFPEKMARQKTPDYNIFRKLRLFTVHD